jgi:hypothetical protein
MLTYSVFGAGREASIYPNCEGDDYWIDFNKLSKQVDLLEKYQDTILCGSRMEPSLPT